MLCIFFTGLIKQPYQMRTYDTRLASKAETKVKMMKLKPIYFFARNQSHQYVASPFFEKLKVYQRDPYFHFEIMLFYVVSVSPFGLPHFIGKIRSTTVLNEKKVYFTTLTSLIFNL